MAYVLPVTDRDGHRLLEVRRAPEETVDDDGVYATELAPDRPGRWTIDISAASEGTIVGAGVLHIDADEVVTPELLAELLSSRDQGFDAYRLASKTMFQGKWLKYSGLYPSYQVRFGHREPPGRIRLRQVQGAARSAHAAHG